MRTDALPLFRSFFTSSIRRETLGTRIVFLGLIAMADSEGMVQATPDAIAALVNVGENEVAAALTRLSAPDPDSTSPDEDGRRVIAVSSNRWRIVNYQAYAARAEEAWQPDAAEAAERRRQQLREAQRTFRKNKASKRAAPIDDVIKSNQNLITSNHPEITRNQDVITSSKLDYAPQMTDTKEDTGKGQNGVISLELGSSNLEPKSSSTTKSKAQRLDTGACARTRSYTAEDPEMRLARFLFGHRRKNDSLAKEPNFQAWAKEFDGLLNREHRDLDDLKAVIQFSQRDHYWLKRIVSAKLFRRNFEMMWMQMGGKNGADRENGGGTRTTRFAEWDD